MTVRLKRAQLGRAVGLDTTVMSARGPARAFAPEWRMVQGHKNQQCVAEGRPLRYPGVAPMTTEEYTALYEQILSRVPLASWRWLYAQGRESGEVTLLCYCREGWFCHTHLIVEYACARYPKAFVDGR